MKIKKWLATYSALVLSACATNFGNHLDASLKNGQVSQLGSAKSFVVSSTDFSSRKIKYSYEKLFVYSQYTQNKELVKDVATKDLIMKRLKGIGMSEAESAVQAGVLVLNYEELMGWDMGEIVKQMRICGQLNAQYGKTLECAEFSEMKFANTHPTRALVVNNLLAILLTSTWPQAAPKEKYRKFELE
jgi:hypothetical protein